MSDDTRSDADPTPDMPHGPGPAPDAPSPPGSGSGSLSGPPPDAPPAPPPPSADSVPGPAPDARLLPPPGVTPPGPGPGGTQGAWGPPGATPGGYAQHPAGTAGASDSRQMAMFAHLSAILASFIGLPFIGPLVIWLLRKDQDPYVAEHGREALNANISYSIYMLAGTVVTVVLSFVFIGFLLIPVLALAGVGWLVVSIIAGIKANNGEHFKYPLTIRFVS